MKETTRKLGAGPRGGRSSASLGLGTSARAHDDGEDTRARLIEHAERSAPHGRRPIVVPIHFWRSTARGVPWPTPRKADSARAAGRIQRVAPPTASSRRASWERAASSKKTGDRSTWSGRPVLPFLVHLEIGAHLRPRLWRFARDRAREEPRNLTGPAEGITPAPQ